MSSIPLQPERVLRFLDPRFVDISSFGEEIGEWSANSTQVQLLWVGKCLVMFTTPSPIQTTYTTCTTNPNHQFFFSVCIMEHDRCMTGATNQPKSAAAYDGDNRRIHRHTYDEKRPMGNFFLVHLFLLTIFFRYYHLDNYH